MSTRGYFALRNAIPGYAFILIVIAINHVPLMEILQKPGFSEFFGAFLAFFYLLSGGAIGFLISQGWWWYWQRHAGILGDHEYDPAVNAFSALYEVDIPQNIRRRRMFVTAMDYVVHTKIRKDHKELLTLAERRWDMFHTLSSTLLALILGLETAIIMRFYFWIIPFREEIIVLTPENIVSSEFLVLSLISISIFILVYLVDKGRIWTRQMSADLDEAIIRRKPINKAKLRTVFPQLYEIATRER